MDEGPSRRSLSPYHEKCFPPYCDNAQLVDKALVSKMSRGELEDKYITFADENLDLKKQNQIKERQLQRLQTAIQRQDKLDKKNGMTPTSVMAGSNKMANLESENKNLQAKVKVLKQQLMNHSYIHSKEARIADAKLKQGQVQAKTPRESEFVIPSQTQSAREAKPDRNVAALKMRITELENQLETNKNKYKNRLGQLEKELAALEKEAAKSGTSVNEQLSQTSRQVKDNTELIKMRMQADKQAAELEELRDLLKTAEEEAKKLKQELKDAKDTVDDLQNQLDREKNKSRTALSEASKGTTHAETIRALEEQIRDLQKEKETLKDTNEKLLQLTQTKSEKSLKSPSGHSILISDLEKSLKDKMDELEELEAKTKDLEQQLFEAKKKPITPTQSVKSVQAEVPNEEPPKECEHCVDLSKQLTSALMDNAKLKAIYQNSLEKPKTPPPTPVSKQSDEALKNLNQRLEDELTKALQELNVLRPIAEEHKNCPKFTPPPITLSKSIQMPGNGSHVSFKEQPEELVVVRHLTPEPSKESVHSQKTIDSERYIALTRQLQQALWENEQLKKELENRGGDEHLKRQNQLLEDELNKALRELREVKPIAEEHNRHCGVKREEIIPVEYYQPIEEHLVPEYAKEITSVRSYGPSVHSNPPTQQISVSPARSHTSMKARQGYVSHVSPPPSEHCVRTVDINDPAQRANLVIVSKHDFDTVLTKKRKYSTEVEMMETVEGAQTLNCKLEICMYDLDIDARMLEYLSSIQPEPKVYVEWSFVGLDQRTAPLPADQALFYTNVMYLGPLSNEVKNYLNKNEMPIDLYLVKSSGNPVRVAEGTLDMLPAMEQPNRGFIRSVYLRGKDLPSRYALDKPVATIHCSFILHECCFGDPPFRDQMEVSIGTLYLKNRDGGVIPDHATHIYIEYALLGHCGPDLETDSVPRGEIMKFNHVKKLRVNDENAPHLKAMLEDRDPKPLRFTVCAEPCSLTTDTEVETVGHADLNLNEEMIRKDRDLVSSQVPVYSMEGEHLGTLSVTLLGIGTLQQIYADSKVKAR